MAMILICTVFVVLILFAGLMDLRRLDQTLLQFMENHGLDISGKIQRDAQENFSSLVQTLRGEYPGAAIFPLSEESFLPPESFINALVNLARRMDKDLDASKFSSEDLKRAAAEHHIWLLALLNEKGQVRFQTRPFPKRLLLRADPVMTGKREISIDIFNQYLDPEKLGSIALRKSNGPGTLFIVLDDPGLRYWGMKVALQKAVDDMGKGQKLPYIEVMDDSGGVLAGIGNLPDKKDDDKSVFGDVLKGKAAVTSRKIVSQGNNLMEILAPVYLDNTVVGVARIGLERDQADRLVEKNRTLMIISMVFSILIGLLSIWFLYQNQNRHLARMEEMRKELQKSERLSSLGQLAAGVAHEIRNPLNAISIASQRLQREFPPAEQEKQEEFSRITGVVRDEVRRLNRIIEEFLTFSRSERLHLCDYPIEAVLQKLARLEVEEARARGIVMEIRLDNTSTPISMDVDKLQQAFLNIVKNAMESITGAGTISIALEHLGNDRIAVRISDTGSGLTPEEVERIFNPEYTTKEKGLGLGLPIAYEIVRGHGGDIRVQSQIGSGTTFEILLPLGTTEAEKLKS